MIIRIIGALIAIGLIYAGYNLALDLIEDHKISEYRRYASIIAETSIAAELHRNDHDRFFTARDSILKKYDVTLGEMHDLDKKFGDDYNEKLVFWNIVSEVTDSMVDDIIRNDTLKK